MFYVLALQNYKSQNKQTTNSRVCLKLSGFSSVCAHRESNTSQSLSHEHPLGGEESFLPSSPPSFLPSFPTDNCRWQPLRLGCIDFGNCLLQIRKATMSWGYSKQGLWGFFPLWAYPKDIDFCCCSPYKERLSLLHQNPSFTKLWYSDLMLRAVGLGSAPAPSWLFPI